MKIMSNPNIFTKQLTGLKKCIYVKRLSENMGLDKI